MSNEEQRSENNAVDTEAARILSSAIHSGKKAQPTENKVQMEQQSDDNGVDTDAARLLSGSIHRGKEPQPTAADAPEEHQSDDNGVDTDAARILSGAVHTVKTAQPTSNAVQKDVMFAAEGVNDEVPKSKKGRIIALCTAGALLLGGCGLFGWKKLRGKIRLFGNEESSVSAAKNGVGNHVVYIQDNCLWYMDLKKRKPIRVSEPIVSDLYSQLSNDIRHHWVDSYDAIYTVQREISPFVCVMPDESGIFYPLEIGADDITLMYHSLTHPEEDSRIIAEQVMLYAPYSDSSGVCFVVKDDTAMVEIPGSYSDNQNVLYSWKFDEEKPIRIAAGTESFQISNDDSRVMIHSTNPLNNTSEIRVLDIREEPTAFMSIWWPPLITAPCERVLSMNDDMSDIMIRTPWQGTESDITFYEGFEYDRKYHLRYLDGQMSVESCDGVSHVFYQHDNTYFYTEYISEDDLDIDTDKELLLSDSSTLYTLFINDTGNESDRLFDSWRQERLNLLAFPPCNLMISENGKSSAVIRNAAAFCLSDNVWTFSNQPVTLPRVSLKQYYEVMEKWRIPEEEYADYIRSAAAISCVQNVKYYVLSESGLNEWKMQSKNSLIPYGMTTVEDGLLMAGPFSMLINVELKKPNNFDCLHDVMQTFFDIDVPIEDASFFEDDVSAFEFYRYDGKARKDEQIQNYGATLQAIRNYLLENKSSTIAMETSMSQRLLLAVYLEDYLENENGDYDLNLANTRLMRFTDDGVNTEQEYITGYVKNADDSLLILGEYQDGKMALTRYADGKGGEVIIENVQCCIDEKLFQHGNSEMFDF